jgi:DNA-binding winged helix-turn-helix (wHTH) protein
MRLRFGDCLFDSDTREFFRSGEAIHLTPKAFRFLELLLESRPRALSKEDLQQRLWPETFVSEANLATLAADVRRAIGEEGRGAHILRTVYGFGYAFSGDAEEEEARTPVEDRYWLTWKDEEIPLGKGENILGRDRAARVRIDDSTISRRHARIVVGDAAATVEDLGSKNGTFVGGRRVERPVRVVDGDVVKVGSVNLIFRTSSGETSTVSVRESGPPTS